jgi:hypothetical protein
MMYRGWTPWASNSVAAVWRRSWKRNRRRSASYPLVGARRLGIVAIRERRTVLTDSAFWNTRATSGSSSIATDPGAIRWANRFGLAFV